MPEKRTDLLALYAGLDIACPATDPRAPLYQSIACLFKKAENIITPLQPRRKRNNLLTTKIKQGCR